MEDLEECLIDKKHNRNMCEDVEYFQEYMIERHDFSKHVELFEIVEDMRTTCNKYDQSFNDLLDRLKDL